mmetsp:Transcript_9550/g.28742  ORF Transcript_9550/g.28742 Transcript_9550/m.28742 type:complete len:221 (+) Transcript_9550:478-1140(+)
MSSKSALSNASPRMLLRSCVEMRPVWLQSRRENVFRRTSSWALMRPISAAARNSVYSISWLLSVSRLWNSAWASLQPMQNLSSRICLSSLWVMVPLFCVSSRRNCSLSSARSSADSDQAIIDSTARRKWEACAKFCRLRRMVVSMRVSLRDSRPLIQGCSSALDAVSRREVSLTNNDRTKSCAQCDSWLKREEKCGLHALMLRRISSSVPWKSGTPVSSM